MEFRSRVFKLKHDNIGEFQIEHIVVYEHEYKKKVGITLFKIFLLLKNRQRQRG